jgi:hypothetical protein
MSKSTLAIGNKIWADRINSAWQSSIDGIFEAGRLVAKAKAELAPSDFDDLIEKRLRFSASVARRLIIVAADERLRAHVHILPPHWSTIYELTKLEDDELDQGVKDGTIRPDMERKDVPKRRKESPLGDAVSVTADSAIPPVAVDACQATPHDDAKAGDSVVTADRHADHWRASRARDAVPHDDSEGGDSVVTAEPGGEPFPTPPEVPPICDACGGRHFPDEFHTTGLREGAGKERQATTAAPWPASAKPGMVAYYVEADNPASALANGLSMAMTASRDLDPLGAATHYPEDMPLLSDDLLDFALWLREFHEVFRARYGNGNDAALAAE